jgi:c-di-GMP-binding flagellar brake protein YcgR
MVSMKEIEESQKAKVSFKLPDNTEKDIFCTVKKIFKDRISLAFPPEALTYAEYLKEGDEIPVSVYTPNGVNIFESMILDSPLESDFMIEYSGDYMHIQRRQYTRSELETKIIVIREENENIITKTMDIGGGGVRFEYNGRFKFNENVQIRLFLPLQLKAISAQGYIIPHVEYLPKNQHVVYFTSITKEDRQKIVKKCYELESALKFIKES